MRPLIRLQSLRARLDSVIVVAILRHSRRNCRIMIPNAVIDQLTEAIGRVLPQGVAQDARKQLNAVLRSRLEQLGLVSREEFDVQQAVLERLRERLVKLEKEFSELQQKQNKD